MGKKQSYYDDEPEVIDMDVLSGMSDDELNNRFYTLEEERAGAWESREPTYTFEIELAYVQREQLLRRGRRAYHDAYLATLRGEAPVQSLADEHESTVTNEV
jgi:hypothetical protein